MATDRVEHVMGTAIGVDVRDAGVPAGRRSTASSTTSARSTRGSAPTARTARSAAWLAASSTEASCSPDLRHVLAACDHLAVDERRRLRCPSAAGRGRPRPLGLRQGLGRRGGRLDPRRRRRARLRDQRRRRHRRPRARRRRPSVARRGPPSGPRPTASRPSSRSPTGPSRRPGPTSAAHHIVDPRTGAPADGASQPDRRRSAARVRRRLRDRGVRDGARRAGAGSPRHPDHDALAITDGRPRAVDRRDGRLSRVGGLRHGPSARSRPGRRAVGRGSCAPPVGRFATAIRPPWRSTIQAAIARPSPVPPPGAPGAR